jgi:hypothetical protein
MPETAPIYAGMQTRSIAHENLRRERERLIEILNDVITVVERKALYAPDADAGWLTDLASQMKVARDDIKARVDEARDYRNGEGASDA